MHIQIPGFKTPIQTILIYRVCARIFDLSIALFLAAILMPPLGAFFSFAFTLLSDRCMFDKIHTRSPGKQLFKLNVAKEHHPLTVRDCILRNLTLAFPTLFLNAGLFGWMLFLLIGIPIAGFELIVLIKNSKHQRLGDLIANTTVESMD